MSVGSAIYVTAVIGLSVCELYMSYELARAVGQPATFVGAWCRTHEHPHLPHTARGRSGGIWPPAAEAFPSSMGTSARQRLQARHATSAAGRSEERRVGKECR